MPQVPDGETVDVTVRLHRDVYVGETYLGGA